MATIYLGKKKNLICGILRLILKRSIESRTGGVRWRQVKTCWETTPHISHQSHWDVHHYGRWGCEWKQTISIKGDKGKESDECAARNQSFEWVTIKLMAWKRNAWAIKARWPASPSARCTECWITPSFDLRTTVQALPSAFHFYGKREESARRGLAGPAAAFLERLKHVICDSISMCQENRGGVDTASKSDRQTEKKAEIHTKKNQQRNEKIQLLTRQKCCMFNWESQLWPDAPHCVLNRLFIFAHPRQGRRTPQN